VQTTVLSATLNGAQPDSSPERAADDDRTDQATCSASFKSSAQLAFFPA
jgi:hypothetical protein